MRRRALSLVELLTVVGILALLAALLLPAFARSRERAKLEGCAARLRQMAVALNLYRGDHDGLGFRYVSDAKDGVLKLPYLEYEPMKAYLGDGRVLRCPEPEGPMGQPYRYRTWDLSFLTSRGGGPSEDNGTASVAIIEGPVPHRAFKPLPGTVVAFCTNHVNDRRDGRDVFEGEYPFVREDTSLGIANDKALRLGYYSAKGWFEKMPTDDEPWRRILRFPGEPWPLDVEP